MLKDNRIKRIKKILPNVLIDGEEHLEGMSNETFNNMLDSINNKEYFNFDLVVIGQSYRYSLAHLEDYDYLQLQWRY